MRFIAASAKRSEIGAVCPARFKVSVKNNVSRTNLMIFRMEPDVADLYAVCSASPERSFVAGGARTTYFKYFLNPILALLMPSTANFAISTAPSGEKCVLSSIPLG